MEWHHGTTLWNGNMEWQTGMAFWNDIMQPSQNKMARKYDRNNSCTCFCFWKNMCFSKWPVSCPFGKQINKHLYLLDPRLIHLHKLFLCNIFKMKANASIPSKQYFFQSLVEIFTFVATHPCQHRPHICTKSLRKKSDENFKRKKPTRNKT